MTKTISGKFRVWYRHPMYISEKGCWVVQRIDPQEILSEHKSEKAAIDAARRYVAADKWRDQ